LCAANAASTSSFTLGHLEEVKRPSKFRRDFIELGGRDLQVAMGFFQAERSTSWFRACILLGAAGNGADPQRAHELEARKSAQIVGRPLAEGGVFRCLADDRVAHNRFAEVVNHRCDGECPTEPFIQTQFGHCSLLRRFPEASHRFQR
jgi:hypothetical protein